MASTNETSIVPTVTERIIAANRLKDQSVPTIVVINYDPNKQSRADLEKLGKQYVTENKVSNFSILEKCLFCPTTGTRSSKQLMFVCKHCEQYI